MVYERGHKKVLGIWLDLVLKVKYSEILIFKAIFLCRKSAESFQKKISLKNTKMGDKLFLIPFFDNFDLNLIFLSNFLLYFFEAVIIDMSVNLFAK